ncbi:unnamed protein product [Staurois parvus]|uniref:Uncharacterized protein n=1 Tax=Staurois parvus TaxID=386267 RepID=A0ABN9FIY8_9NEOB|nr:unnamed protein product [Staurois parvus]
MATIRDLWQRPATYGGTAADILTLGVIMAAISDLWRRSGTYGGDQATYGGTAVDILTLGGTDLGSLTSPVTPIQ